MFSIFGMAGSLKSPVSFSLEVQELQSLQSLQ